MKYFPPFLYLAVAVGIMAPLYAPGFIFLLDMVWGPRIDIADVMRNGVNHNFPMTALLSLLNLAIPADIIQKILLTAVLFLPGISMYALARRTLPISWAMVSGLLFQLNPYVYERFVAGQWKVLLGYGFFPLVLLFLLAFLAQRKEKHWWIFALSFAVYPLLSIHWSYIAGIFLLVFGIVWLGQNRKFPALLSRIAIRRSLVLAALFLLVNSFWLVGFFAASGSYIAIGEGDFSAFATRPDSVWGGFFNVLSLYGFWRSVYLLPKDFLSFWWVLTPIMIACATAGAIVSIRRRDALCVATTLVFLPAFLIATGDASPITQSLNRMILDGLPLFGGLRDTAKAIGVLAFAYALLAPVGVRAIVPATARPAAAGAMFLLPFLTAGTLLGGAMGQLKVYDYPRAWYEADTILREDGATGVLFLPWRAYLQLDFAGGLTVANPAQAFFSSPVIAGQNTDNPFLLDAEANLWNQKMTSIIQGVETIEENRPFFAEQGVTHILLAKTDDWERYEQLVTAAPLETAYESATIAVYAFTAR